VSAGFTPGPWAEDYCDADEVWHVDAGAYPFGSTVCEIDQRTLREGDAEANARLIAAAPELYEAAAKHLEWIEKEHAGPQFGALTRDTHPLGEAI
jgi:hypothetical protein